MRNNTFFALYSIILFIALSFFKRELDKLVPEPFMDEFFHIRQAQEYFNGNWFKWDPMITTPPGLYVISLGIIKTLRLSASVSTLRLINSIFAVLLFVTVKLIQPDPFGNERALLISLLPNLFIFYGLFYTDTGSVLFCLLAYLSVKKGRNLLFLMASLAALLFRQTNIIWVAGFCIADQICSDSKGDLKMIWKRRKFYYTKIILSLILMILFALGVYWNGGIALGDKTSHSASAHFAQFFYCTTTICLFCWPILIKYFKHIKIVQFLVVSITCFFAIRYGTIVHPYLLADNRHWTNFIWRRALKFETFRFALIPIHSISFLLIYENLKSNRGLLWTFGYFVTCALVLIPSPLMEPRYYILPLVFFLLNCKITSRRLILLQLSVFVAINCFIIGMFLYKPFMWPDGLQRRIW